MGKRIQRRLQQQENVLKTAAEILRTSPGEGLKMSRIATLMGCSVGGLYRYYPSKEAIITALQLRGLNTLQRMLASSIAQHESVHGHGKISLLEVLFDSWTTFELQAPDEAQLLNRFAWRDTVILTEAEQTVVGQKVFEIVQLLEDSIDALTTAKTLVPGNAKLRAYTLWGMIFGFVQLRQRQRSGMSSLPLSAIRECYLRDLRVSWTHA